MTDRIGAFIEAHPEGWNHQQWLGLLEELEQDGVDVSEPEAVGLELERERLAWQLRRLEVKGLGPKRVDAVANKFKTFWSLRQASVTDIAEIKTIPPALAEAVFEAIHETN